MANYTMGVVPTNFSNLENVSTEICKPFTAPTSVSSQVIMSAAYSILLLLTLAGNSLVIIVFFRRYGQLATPVNYFIVNMAASDLFIPLCVIPRRLQEIYLGWSPWMVGGVVGDMLCRLVNFAEEVSIAVSMESMVFIAVERCWSVVYPMKLPLISRETSPRFIVFSWIFAIVSFSYYFAAYKLVDKNNRLYCKYGLPQVFDTWQDLWRADRIMLLVVFVVIPFVLLTFCYTATIITLRRQEKLAINIGSDEERKRAKKNKKITFMLVIVVILFFISWTPHYLYFFVQYYPPEQRWRCRFIKQLYLVAKYMNYIYTAVNPFIYYMFNDSYRRGFQAILCCRKPNSRQYRSSRVAPSQSLNESKF